MRNLEFEPEDEESDNEEMQRQYEEQQERFFRYVTTEHGHSETDMQAKSDYFAHAFTSYVAYNRPHITRRLQLSSEQNDLLHRVSNRIQQRTVSISSFGRMDAGNKPLLITQYYTHNVSDMDLNDPHADHMKVEWDALGEFPKFIGFYGRNQTGEILKDVYFSVLPIEKPEEQTVRRHLNIAPSEEVFTPSHTTTLFIGRNSNPQAYKQNPFMIPESSLTTYSRIGNFRTNRLKQQHWYVYGCSETSYMKNVRAN